MSAGVPQRAQRLLRDPDFLKLWIAQGISQVGTQVSLLAILVIGALTMDLDPLGFALIGTIEFLPYVLFSLPAGALVDRFDRRRVLVVTDIGRAVAIASIPVAYLVGALTIWQLYLVGFVVGTLSVFFEVAYLSYLPALVRRDQLVEGNAKLEASRSVAQVAGPGLAGASIALLTAPIAMVIDAFTYLISALFVVRIRHGERRSAAPIDDAPRRPIGRDIAEGIRFVAEDPNLRAIAVSMAVANLFTSFILAIIVLYLARDLRLAPEAIGAVFAFANVGLLAGALSAGLIGRVLGVGPTIGASSLLFGPSLLLIPLAPTDSPLAGAVTIALGMFFASFLNVIYNVNQASLRQAITPDALLGRMNATMRFIVWGTIPAGQIAGGLVAEAAGLRAATLIGALGALVIFVPVIFSPLRTLRTIPEAQ